MNAEGHGTYSELVEKEPGSSDFLLGVGDYLTVYVDTSQIHTSQPQLGLIHVTDAQDYQQVIGNLHPVKGFNGVELNSDLTVSVSF